MVREAFEYAQAQGVPLCAFLGDTCVTLRMADELRVRMMRVCLPWIALPASCLLCCLLWHLWYDSMHGEVSVGLVVPAQERGGRDGHSRCTAMPGLQGRPWRRLDVRSCCARMQELHSVYYEPLAQVCPSVEAILAGPPVKKMLFMTDPARVDQELRPHWEVGCNQPAVLILPGC